MKTVYLKQGSPEWHAHRAEHFNASDAPAMMGESTYKSRMELLNEIKTGLTPEVDAQTQKRLDEGHRLEALARPLAEAIIGEELSPLVGVEGEYSASFDGLTMIGDVNFEHKTMNESLRGISDGKALPAQYLIQMEHQMMVSGAEKTLFMATSRDKDGNLLEAEHVWHYQNLELRAKIIAGWAQFKQDLEGFEAEVIQEKPKAQAIMALPSLNIQIKGEVVSSNLVEFKGSAETFIATISTDLKTDDDFANGEAVVKFCKEAEDGLEATKKSALAQTSSIDELMRTIDFVNGLLRNKRLVLEGAIKTKKEAVRLAILNEFGGLHYAHIMAIEAETKGFKLPVVKPDFAGEMKGKKTIKGLREACHDLLAKAKIEADEAGRDLRVKLEWFERNGKAHNFLFSDLANLILKPMDDFMLVINTRIEKHLADIKAKEEAEFAAKAAELAAKEEFEARAEKQAAELEANKAAEVTEKFKAEEPVVLSGARKVIPITTATKQERPSDEEIISALALFFEVSSNTAIDWILDLAPVLAVSKRLAHV